MQDDHRAQLDLELPVVPFVNLHSVHYFVFQLSLLHSPLKYYTIIVFMQAARDIWESSGRVVAPNGGVMRTSILGVHDFGDIDKVIANTKEACQVTHADPRCIASCVAVTTAVALMLQGKHLQKSGDYDIEAVIEEAFNHARDTLETAPEVIRHGAFALLARYPEGEGGG